MIRYAVPHAALVLAVASGPAFAADAFPSRPIRMIVAFFIKAANARIE